MTWRCPHSTALEGNTLVLRQVQMLLDQGRAVGAKPLQEYNEVQGYADAARWVYRQALDPGEWHDGRLLTIGEVRQIHHTAMTPVWDVAPHPDATEREGPGDFREHDIHPFSAGVVPPSWPLVPARLHNTFEQIHPFIDGNGRTGRLVLNLVLVRLGYPPVIIFKKQRDAYLSAMQRADAGDPGSLGELVARAMHDNLNRFIVPNVAGPVRLVPLAALVDKEFSLPALRQAARRGRLEAYQGRMGYGGAPARRWKPIGAPDTSGSEDKPEPGLPMGPMRQHHGASERRSGQRPGRRRRVRGAGTVSRP